MQRNNRFDSARLRLVLTMELCEAKFIHHLLARGQQNNIMTEITWLVAAFGLTLLGGYAVGNQEAVIEPQGSIRIEDEGHSRHDLLTSPKTGSLSPPYGTGCSWPTHHTFVSEHSNPLGSQARQSAYDTFMNGCFGDNLKFQQECLRWEQDRISMALNQPAASQNYTHAGYAKVETPPSVGKMLREFWEDNRDKGEYELWDHSNTYVNHWENPTTMVDINHLEFGLPESLQWEIVNAVQSVLEAWTGQPLVLTSMYGIRVYKEGSILAPHVDRLPLVSSAIINVAQDLEADWPLEVIGHDGVARNLTIGVDDMILYESHSVIHGRPFPLKGKFCANIFIHFEPLGHSIRHMQRGGYGSDVFKSSYPATARSNYERALENKTARRNQATQEATDEEMEAPSPFLPPYVNPDKEVRWRQQFEYEKETTVSIRASFLTILTKLESNPYPKNQIISAGALDCPKAYKRYPWSCQCPPCCCRWHVGCSERNCNEGSSQTFRKGS